MKVPGIIFALALLTGRQAMAGFDDWIESLDQHLAVSAFHGNFRAHVSGLLDVEGYAFTGDAPGLIFTEENSLFNPRFTTFLDVQAGPHVYAFVQARVDRGFDPHDENADVRLDEYAVRISPWNDGRFSLQVGRFATVIGNWVERHLSWENPFVTAPAPYENLTGMWDSAPPLDAEELAEWGNALNPGEYGYTKYLKLPIVWGPSYASGISIAGQIGKFDYAVEMKNASLSSRPESWDVTEIGFEHPTFSGRLGFHPNQMWNFGFSASNGVYLHPDAREYLPAGRDLDDYRQLILAQDISFAWHHLQVWAEFFEARFENPDLGDADTFAYFIEAKYKFTPQLSAALRWNQQLYDTVRVEDQDIPWGNELRRLDTALIYRFTPHTQLKVQYSIAAEDNAVHDYEHTVAGQLTLKF